MAKLDKAHDLDSLAEALDVVAGQASWTLKAVEEFYAERRRITELELERNAGDYDADHRQRNRSASQV